MDGLWCLLVLTCMLCVNCESKESQKPNDLQKVVKTLQGGDEDMEDLGEAMKGLSNLTGQLGGIDLGPGGLALLLKGLDLGGSDNNTGVNHHPAIVSLLPKPAGSPTDNTPATTQLLKFVEDIEKVPGGGNLLGLLIKAMVNVTETQLKEVTGLLPLITAHPLVADGGFLKLMAEMNATDAGQKLVQWSIGILSNVTNGQIQELTAAAPMLGPILMKELPSLMTLVENPDTKPKDLLNGVFTLVQGLDLSVLSKILGNSTLAKTIGSVISTAKSSHDIGEFVAKLGTHYFGNQNKLIPSVTETDIKELTDELLPLITSHPLADYGGFLKLMAEMVASDDGQKLVQWSIGLLSKITNGQIQELTAAAPMFGPILMKQLPSLMTLAENPDTKPKELLNGLFTMIQGLDLYVLSKILGNSTLANKIGNVISTAKSSHGIGEFAVEIGRQYFGNQTADAAKSGLAIMSIVEMEGKLMNISATDSFESFFQTINAMNTTVLNSALGDSNVEPLVVSYVSRLQAKEGAEISSQCKRDLARYYQGLKQLDMWALQMLDATGKPGSSLLKGAVKFFGNYDECLAIKTTVDREDGDGKRDIQASYCRLAFIIPQSVLDTTGALDTPMPLPRGFVPTLEWHLCLPRSCDEDTISSALSVLPLEVINSSVYKVECTQEEDIQHDTGAIVSVAILGVLIALSLFGTVYDVITWELRRIRKKYGSDNDKFDQPAISGFQGNGSVKTPESNGISMVAINGVKVDNSNPPETDSISSDTEPYYGEDYDEEDYDGVCRRLLLAFSLGRNTEKIFCTKKREGNLGCIHGIRVLSMAWIILGHIIVYTKGVTDENITEVLKQIKDFTMQAVVNASLAVDSFFLISGCLVAYLFINEKVANGKLKARQLIMYYVHRIWRLDPMYLVILMCYTCLFKYLMDGPLRTDGIDYDNTHCQKNWWTNALYINNVYRSDEGCMRWTWFMASDMQFYIIAPLALVPLALGLSALGVIVIVILFITQIATYAYKELSVDGSLLKNVEDFEEQVYFMPWCRVGVFAMGILLGFILHKTKCKVHIPRFALVIGWQVALCIGLLCTYITWSEWQTGHITWDRDTRLIHETLSRPGWCLFVSWIIFVCCTGHGGVINRLLSWSFWIPLGRLTYGAYLIHPILITYTDFSKRSLVYVDFIYIAYQYIGTFVLSYALAFVFSVLVEAPCLALEKVALGRYRKQR